MAYSVRYETRNGSIKEKTVDSSKLRAFLLGVRRTGSSVMSFTAVR